MGKTEILSKINEAADIRSNLEKTTEELAIKVSQVRELEQKGANLTNQNTELKTQLDEILLKAEKSQKDHIKTNDDLHISLINSNKKSEKLSLILALVSFLLMAVFAYTMYLFFFSDKLSDNEKKKFNEEISSEKKKTLIIKNTLENKSGEINTLEQMISKQEIKIDGLNRKLGTIRKEYESLNKDYKNGKNCSRVPFVK